MSLFSTREWWAARLGDSEEFDQGSLCAANIDNDPSGAVKLVTASLSGVLRVHLPRARDYRVEDCLLEVQLEAGILQIEAGYFTGANGGLCLAVLFPRKLAVLRFEAAGSSFLQMTRQYEHPLEHTAANMAVGKFGGGGAAGMDLVCVQSYDGQLSVFEGGIASFSRFLPGCLIPGPIRYCPATDSFVTCNAALELESYRYGVLAAAGGGKEAAAGPPDLSAPSAPSTKRIHSDWKLILGESAVDICLARVASETSTSTSTNVTPGSSRRDLGKPLRGPAGAPGFTTAGFTSSGPSGGTVAGGTGGTVRQELLVVCEHSLFVVSAASGQLLLQRRLEYHPAACWPYPAAHDAGGTGGGGGGGGTGASPGDNLLVATHTRALLVYQGPALAWAARLELQPVAMRVTELGGVRGMIVALDDAGRLSVFYLGTDPPSHAVAPACDAKALDYAALDQEHRQLVSKIRAAGGAGANLMAGAAAAASSSASRLIIKAHVPTRLDSLNAGGAGAFGGPMGAGGAGDAARQVMVRLTLASGGPGPVKDVHLSVSAPAPVAVSDASITIDEVPSASKAAAAAGAGAGGAAEPATAHLAFFAGGDGRSAVPASNVARVVATWRHPPVSGEPCCSTLEFGLPLALFCSAVTPVKDAGFKLTLDTNRDPPHMQLLFHDLVAQASPSNAEALSRSQGANVLGFQFGSLGPVVSVLVSKAGGRYRVQSDCFHAMWLIVQELTQRLVLHYHSADSKPGAPPPPDGGRLAVSLQEGLPLQDVFDLIDKHFAAWAAEQALNARLEERAQQFRSVQKRLLVRFKDKTPAPLAQLDALMGETYDQLLTLAEEQEAAQAATREAALSLAAALQLLVLLVRFKFGLGEQDGILLRQALMPEAVEERSGEIGWEVQAEASMTHLLRTSLARSSKEAAATVPPLAAAKDTQRLKKHMSLVLERLAKGMRLGEGAGAGVAAAAAAAAGGASGGVPAAVDVGPMGREAADA